MSMTPDSITPKPNQPIRSDDLPWEDYTRDSTRYGDRTRPLGAHGGAAQMGFNLVEIPSGKQTTPFHWHQREEEHFYVLSGRLVMRIGDDRHVMGPGDYVCFPAGTGIGHAMLNPFDEPCRVIVAGTPQAHPLEVAVFPDSGKAHVRALKALIRWPVESLGYNDGEDTENAVGPQDLPADLQNGEG